MNNKGFAISSVIYGLAILGILIIAILMGTLSSTRNNITQEAKAVEEFLLNHSQTDVSYYGVRHSSSNYQYRIPDGESGWYRIEAFGQAYQDTGLGSYTTGIIYANEGDVFRIIIDSGKTEIRMNGTGLLMLAAAGDPYGAPGGGANICYSSSVDGGDINMTTFTSSSQTFTGIDKVDVGICSTNSFIAGYPGLTMPTSQNYAVLDGLILPGASGVKEGKVNFRRIASRDEITPEAARKNPKFDHVDSISLTYSEVELPVESIWYSYHDGYDEQGHFKTHVVNCGYPCNNIGGKNLDEITIMFPIEQYAKKNTGIMQIVLNNQIIYQSSSDYGITIGGGLHFSAYQPDPYINIVGSASDPFPDHGNYYIFPVTTDNKILSAGSNAADDANRLQIEPIMGESRQMWSIDKINDPSSTNYSNIPNQTGRKEYRIMELARYKALNIYYDENTVMNFVSASETFNTLSRNAPQIWNIYSLGDTTYAIKTVVPSSSPTLRSGFLFAKPAGEGPNNINDVLIGPAANQGNEDESLLPTNIERFFLYSLDFSR